MSATQTLISEFAKMDMFFLVATIGFVMLGVLLAIALVYAIKLLRTLDHIAKTVEEEAHALKGDLDDVRASVRQQGSGLVSSLGVLFGFMNKTGKRLHAKKRRSS
jgi:hypothetical protein